jgi:hypothetical protein
VSCTRVESVIVVVESVTVEVVPALWDLFHRKKASIAKMITTNMIQGRGELFFRCTSIFAIVFFIMFLLITIKFMPLPKIRTISVSPYLLLLVRE